MSPKKLYDVWVISEKTNRWERYTAQPFLSIAAARRWAQTYIPRANWDVREKSEHVSLSLERESDG